MARALFIAKMNDVTQLLGALRRGDADASGTLLELVYSELHQLASARMSHEPAGHTLQPTALVHEAWLRLGGAETANFQSRAHFFGAAAEAMRRILIERARRKLAPRHGGGLQRVDIDEVEIATGAKDDDELLALHAALDKFVTHSPRKAELVKLRYFIGLTLDEAAEILDISLATAKRDWTYARAWLFREIRSA